MAESIAESQLDFLLEADAISRKRTARKAAAVRYGIPELAARLDLDESTLRNQLDYRKRPDGKGFWKPSADCDDLLWFHDQPYRVECLRITNEQIAEIEVVTPEDFAREMYTLARANEFGRDANEKVIGLYRRMKKPSAVKP